MNFNPDTSCHGLEKFDLFNIREETEKLLVPVFGEEITKMFMKCNFEDLYNKINNIKYDDANNDFLVTIMKLKNLLRKWIKMEGNLHFSFVYM